MIRSLEVFSNTEEKIYDINGPACGYTRSKFLFDVSCGIILNLCYLPLCDNSGEDIHQIMQIKNDAGIPYGTINKEWNGWSRIYESNQKFKIEFPTNIDDKTKALLLGATMLVVSILA